MHACLPASLPLRYLAQPAPCCPQPNVTALDGAADFRVGSGQMLASSIDRLASLLQPLGVDPTYLQAVSAKLMGGIGEQLLAAPT